MIRAHSMRDVLELVVVDHLVHRAHPVHLLGGVGLAEEEDLAGELLPHHLGEIGAAEAAVETDLRPRRFA